MLAKPRTKTNRRIDMIDAFPRIFVSYAVYDGVYSERSCARGKSMIAFDLCFIRDGRSTVPVASAVSESRELSSFRCYVSTSKFQFRSELSDASVQSEERKKCDFGTSTC
jgi:hypothetical protein